MRLLRDTSLRAEAERARFDLNALESRAEG